MGAEISLSWVTPSSDERTVTPLVLLEGSSEGTGEALQLSNVKLALQGYGTAPSTESKDKNEHQSRPSESGQPLPDKKRMGGVGRKGRVQPGQDGCAVRPLDQASAKDFSKRSTLHS